MALPSLTNAANAIGQGISSAISMLPSGTLSQSSERSQSYTNSYGYDSSWGYTSAANAANASDWSVAKTYGDLATEWDRVNAERANAMQEAFMQKQMQYNAAEAAKTRDWETYMSNTSYQRAVKDLIAAGLNPILAAGNFGASTPTGATASSALATAHKANATAPSESYSQGTSQSSGYSSGANGSYGENTSESKSRSKSNSNSQPVSYALAQALRETANTGRAVATAAASVAAHTAGSAQYSAPSLSKKYKKADKK